MIRTGYMFLLFSLMNSLLDFQVSGCSSDQCSDKPKFSTSRLVVKYGDPASATCVACQSACIGGFFDLEKPLGDTEKNGTTLSWTAANVNEWGISLMCYYVLPDETQCCTQLPSTVYQPPEDVSISVVNHSGPMSESGQYTLQCDVQNVAPLRNLIVTFYKGLTELGQLKSTKTTRKPAEPASENFTLDFTASKEDNGIQFWCEAKLQLGPDGPQTPPVVKSRNLTATVYYGPQLKVSANPDIIKILKGETLHLNCSAEGNPAPSYKWTLPSGHSFYNDSVLTIKSVDFGEAGQYICTVDNNVKSVQVNFTVDVQDGPKLKVPTNPDPIRIMKGETLHLNCSAEGNPAPSYKWTLPSGHSFYNDSVLTIKSVDFGEAGQYICTVDNNVKSVQVNFTVVVQDGPKLKVPANPDPIRIMKGETLHLNCSSEGNPAPSYKWTLPSGHSFYNDSVLTIKSVDFGEAGQYICTVDNNVKSVQVNFTVVVQDGPKLKVPTNPDPIRIMKGETLQLNCSAEGNPAPSYKWTLPSGQSFYNDSVLTIKSVDFGQAGQYICTVDNNVKSVQVNFTVNVQDGPKLKVPANPDPIRIMKGETLQLNCSAEGNPAPSYKWTLPSGHSFYNDSVLTIKSVDFGEAGQYICTVDNNVKSVQVNFTVDVQANSITSIIVGVIVGVAAIGCIGGLLYKFCYRGR